MNIWRILCIGFLGFSILAQADFDQLRNPSTTLPSVLDWKESGAFEETERAKAYREFQVLTVDTRNERVCQNIRRRLYETRRISKIDYQEFCIIDLDKPFISIVVAADDRSFIQFPNLSDRQKRLVRQTRNFIPLGIGMLAILHALPESATGWESFEWEGIGKRWRENVKAGPERDPDSGFFNYFAHPYVGAAYYQTARHEGFSRLESFAYSAFMSTVIWEYGIEAVSAVPSTQDLIITPVIGSLVGELFYHWTKRIEANGGYVAGSKRLGTWTKFALHPAGTLLDFSNSLFPEDVFEESKTYFRITRDSSRKPVAHFGVTLWLKKR